MVVLKSRIKGQLGSGFWFLVYQFYHFYNISLFFGFKLSLTKINDLIYSEKFTLGLLIFDYLHRYFQEGQIFLDTFLFGHKSQMLHSPDRSLVFFLFFKTRNQCQFLNTFSYDRFIRFDLPSEKSPPEGNLTSLFIF